MEQARSEVGASKRCRAWRSKVGGVWRWSMEKRGGAYRLSKQFGAWRSAAERGVGVRDGGASEEEECGGWRWSEGVRAWRRKRVAVNEVEHG